MKKHGEAKIASSKAKILAINFELSDISAIDACFILKFKDINQNNINDDILL